VIGGSAGIGLAIAKRLAEGGAEVLLTGQDPERLAGARAQLGAAAHAVAHDPADPAAVRALAPAVRERLGTVDQLFLNAGVRRPAPVGEVTEEHYDRLFAVNTRSVFFTVRTLLPLLADGGSITFTGPSAAERLAAAGAGVDAMSRAAVRSFAQVLAVELADRGVRVNTVLPGFIAAPGGGDPDADSDADAGTGLNPDAYSGGADTPLRRHGSAEEVARAAIFLAAEATFTTGVGLAVDGGFGRQVEVLRC
jgi:NAD(P)-dependent dehydrogenase (short-subunit alcohol dehydrogenase family)